MHFFNIINYLQVIFNKRNIIMAFTVLSFFFFYIMRYMFVNKL